MSVGGTRVEGTPESRSLWVELLRRSIPQPTDPVDAPESLGAANRVVESVEAHPREQVGQVPRAILDGDHLADTECAVDIAHDDSILGMTLQRDHDLAAIGEIPCLAEITKRRGSQPTLIQEDKKPEHLDD